MFRKTLIGLGFLLAIGTTGCVVVPARPAVVYEPDPYYFSSSYYYGPCYGPRVVVVGGYYHRGWR